MRRFGTAAWCTCVVTIALGITTVVPNTTTDHIVVTRCAMSTDPIAGTRCDSTIDRMTGIAVSTSVSVSEADTTSDTTVSAPASGSEADRNIDITDIAAAFGCVIAADGRAQRRPVARTA